jgi:hypothetical protein
LTRGHQTAQEEAHLRIPTRDGPLLLRTKIKKNAELEVRMSMRSRGDMKNATSDPVLSTPLGFLLLMLFDFFYCLIICLILNIYRKIIYFNMICFITKEV